MTQTDQSVSLRRWQYASPPQGAEAAGRLPERSCNGSISTPVRMARRASRALVYPSARAVTSYGLRPPWPPACAGPPRPNTSRESACCVCPSYHSFDRTTRSSSLRGQRGSDRHSAPIGLGPSPACPRNAHHAKHAVKHIRPSKRTPATSLRLRASVWRRDRLIGRSSGNSQPS